MENYPSRVVFSERAYSAIVAETLEHLKTETGGIFLGVKDDDAWFILETLDPGPKSTFQPAYFEYDTPYVNHLANKIARFYTTSISLLGLWHRHPGSLDTFSNVDHGTNNDYVSLCQGEAISGLINIDPYFRMTLYHVSNDSHRTVPTYKPVAYEVSDEHIPAQYFELKTTAEILTSQSISHVKMSRNNIYEPRTTELYSNSFGFFDKVKEKLLGVGPEQKFGVHKAPISSSGETSDNNVILESFSEEIDWLSTQDDIEADLQIRHGELWISMPSLKLKWQFALSEDGDKVAKINGKSIRYQIGMLAVITESAQRRMDRSANR